MRELILMLSANAGLAAFLDVNGNAARVPDVGKLPNSLRERLSLFQKKSKAMKARQLYAMSTDNPLFHESDSDLGKKFRPNDESGCNADDVSEANRLLAYRGSEWLLNPEYEDFMTRCIETIGGVPIETLMTAQAQSVLLTLRKVVGIDLAEEVPLSRTKIDAKIKTLWKTIIKSPDLVKKVVSVPNYMVLRYAAGVENGTRYLLENGGLLALLHNKDSHATPQINLSLAAMMWKPLSQLLSLAQPLTGDARRSDTHVFRPKYLEDVRFVWGDDPNFRTDFKRSLGAKVKDLLAIRAMREGWNVRVFIRGLFGGESMCDIFTSKMDLFEHPFDMINIKDRDKLEALVGSECAQDLLKKRARIAVSKLIEHSATNCKSKQGSCPFAKNFGYMEVATDPVTLCENIVPDLRQYPEIFSRETADYIGFFLGPVMGHPIAQLGPEHMITVDDLNRKKVKVAVWDAFMPSLDMIWEMFDKVMLDQMEEIAKERARFSQRKHLLPVPPQIGG